MEPLCTPEPALRMSYSAPTIHPDFLERVGLLFCLFRLFLFFLFRFSFSIFFIFFCAPFVPHPRAMWAFIVPTVYPPWWMTWVDDLEWRGHGGGNASSSSTVLLAPAGA